MCVDKTTTINTESQHPGQSYKAYRMNYSMFMLRMHAEVDNEEGGNIKVCHTGIMHNLGSIKIIRTQWILTMYTMDFNYVRR